MHPSNGALLACREAQDKLQIQFCHRRNKELLPEPAKRHSVLELQQLEQPSALGDPRLTEQHRSRARQLDRDREHERERRWAEPLVQLDERPGERACKARRCIGRLGRLRARLARSNSAIGQGLLALQALRPPSLPIRRRMMTSLMQK